MLLSDPQRQYFIDSICSTLIGINTDDSFLKFRKKLILAFANEILNFSNVFIGDNIPIITSDEVDIIDNQLVYIVNNNKYYQNRSELTNPFKRCMKSRNESLFCFHPALVYFLKPNCNIICSLSCHSAKGIFYAFF